MLASVSTCLAIIPNKLVFIAHSQVYMSTTRCKKKNIHTYVYRKLAI